MKVKSNVILFFYDSKDLQDRQALGYAKSLKDHLIKEFDVRKDSISSLNLELLIDDYDLELDEIIDKDSKVYSEHLKNSDLDRKGKLDVITKNPSVVKTPIAFYRDTAELTGSPYDFISKDLKENGIELKRWER